jgi:YfiH family protein
MPDGVVYYASPLLDEIGVPHAFSTRVGGVSPPPFDSLNLGNPNGCQIQDDYEHIWMNYYLLQQAIGCGDRELCRVHQVHGSEAAVVVAGERFDTSIKADALVTRDPARVLSVRVADCVPILLASEDGRCVAAVHAGWRGVVANVVGSAIDRMIREDASISPEMIVAAIGPCIGKEAFEVGPEVAREFERTFGEDAPLEARAAGKAMVDLREAVRRQLNSAGVPAGRIDTTDRCTFRDRAEFFSHRGDNGVTGRMAALIGVRTSP